MIVNNPRTLRPDTLKCCIAVDGNLGKDSLSLLRDAGLDTGPLGAESRTGYHLAAEALLLIATRGSETAWLTGQGV